MTEHSGPDRLPCGRSWAALLDQLDDQPPGPIDDHRGSCPHCRAASAEIERYRQSLAAVVGEAVTAPAGLTERVMRRVRDAARDGWYSVIAGDHGSTRIAARVIATLARQAAARVPGVAVALGRTTEPSAAARQQQATEEHRAPGTAVGVFGGTAVIDLALAAEYGTDLPRVAGRVRRAVIRDVQELAGLDAVQVNVSIDDITS